MKAENNIQDQSDTVNGKSIQDFLDSEKANDLVNVALAESSKWAHVARSNKGSIKLRHTPKHDQKPGEVKVYSESDKNIYLMEKRTMDLQQRKVAIKQKLKNPGLTIMEELILCFQTGKQLSTPILRDLHKELTGRTVNPTSLSSQMSSIVNSTAATDWFEKTEGSGNHHPPTYVMKDKYLDIPSEDLKEQILASYRKSVPVPVHKKQNSGKRAGPIDIDLNSKEVRDALRYIKNIFPSSLFKAVALLNGGKRYNSKSLAFAINSDRDNNSTTPETYPGTRLRVAIKRGGLPGILVEQTGNGHHHYFGLKKEVANLDLADLVLMMNGQIAVPQTILHPEPPEQEPSSAPEDLDDQAQESETSQADIINKLIIQNKALMERCEGLQRKFTVLEEGKSPETSPNMAPGNQSFDLNINLNFGSTLLKCLEIIRGK